MALCDWRLPQKTVPVQHKAVKYSMQRSRIDPLTSSLNGHSTWPSDSSVYSLVCSRCWVVDYSRYCIQTTWV